MNELNANGLLANSGESLPASVDKLLSLSRAFLIIFGLFHLFLYSNMGLVAEQAFDRLWEKVEAEARAEGTEPDRAGHAEFKAGWVRKIQIIGFSFAVVGLAYLTLGFLAKRRPLVAVSVGIPLAIGDWIAYAMIYPERADDIGPIMGRLTVLLLLTVTLIGVLRHRRETAARIGTTT